MATSNLHLIILITTSLITLTTAEIRFNQIHSDSRSIIPFDEFGFAHHGILELHVSQISLSNPSPDLDYLKLGFFLSTKDALLHVSQEIQLGDITCALHSPLVKKVYTFDHLHGATSFESIFKMTEAADQFTLLFANCLHQVEVSMDVKSAMFNLEGRSSEKRDYLSAGKSVLPRVYFMFSIVYCVMVAVWISLLCKKRLTVYGIHLFMLAVVVLKTLSLLCEAEDKSYIKRTGRTHGSDMLFYIFSFLKWISLFTLLVVIANGWSLLKPFLYDTEKKVLMIVIPLQVVANITAQVVINEITGPNGKDWAMWRLVFLVVDALCCCAVLFPIAWSIRNLRELAARTDGKAAVNLMKLTIFRHYYVVVICYIYFTRVAVYALETITSYKYLWTSVVAAELATLAFYLFKGYKFRPEEHNPYFAVAYAEEDAAAEPLKHADEFELLKVVV